MKVIVNQRVTNESSAVYTSDLAHFEFRTHRHYTGPRVQDDQPDENLKWNYFMEEEQEQNHH